MIISRIMRRNSKLQNQYQIRHEFQYQIRNNQYHLTHEFNAIAGFMTRRIASSSYRYYSSRSEKKELEEVINNIDLYHNKLSDIFTLTKDEVSKIKEEVLSGNYQFKPLQVEILNQDEDYSDRYYHIAHTKVLGSNIGIGVLPVTSDNLVLSSLAKMLNKAIYKNFKYIKNSFGFRCLAKDFYYYLISRGKVDGLYKIDLTRSAQTLNKSRLLSKVESIIGNKTVIELIQSFLEIPYSIHDSSINIDLYNMNIPPVGYITMVLMNLFLIDLDLEFKNNYPNIVYIRYMHEAYILNSSLSEQEITSLLDELTLSGKLVNIKPGESMHNIYGGHISITSSGMIKVEYKE